MFHMAKVILLKHYFKILIFHFQLSSEESPELRTAVQNHFEAIKVVTGAVHHKTRHRQSLICLSRRYVLKYGLLLICLKKVFYIFMVFKELVYIKFLLFKCSI